MIISDNFAWSGVGLSDSPIAAAGRYHGDYWPLRLDWTGERRLTGQITIPEKSAAYLSMKVEPAPQQSHNFVAGVGPISIPINVTDPMNLGAESALLDNQWVNKFLGVLGAGTYSINLRGTSTGLVFAYIDAILAVPFVTSAGTGWIEDDDPRVLYHGNWGRFPAATIFPYTVVAQTGSGSSYNANVGHSCSLAVDVKPGESLDLHAITTAGSGRLRVYIDNVLTQTIDLYSNGTFFRVKKNIPISAGEHYVRLQIDAVKNPASSGFQCEIDGFSLTAPPSDAVRSILMADYTESNVRQDDGGCRIAFDSDKYNQDNDAGYAAMTLMYAYQATQDIRYAQAAKKSLQWLWNTQDVDGAWHWGYSRNDNTGVYSPWVNDYYVGVGITDIKTIDAAQAVPVYALWLYAYLVPNDMAWVNAVKGKFKLGIDKLIADNYDASNGFFYSSWQYKPAGGGWVLWEAQYSAGQADVYVGLLAAHALFGEQQYKDKATFIEQNVDAAFWRSAGAVNNVYTVGLFGVMGGSKVQDDTLYYTFAQGWMNWVFPSLSHGVNALNTVISWIQPDGYSVHPPGLPEPETSYTSWLQMGLRAAQQQPNLVQTLKQRHRMTQRLSYPLASQGHGAVLFSGTFPYPYKQTASWSYMGFNDLLFIRPVPGLIGATTGTNQPTQAHTKQVEAITHNPSGIVSIFLDKCIRVFGTSPCLATGAPCYNTWTTCKYKSAYSATVAEYKFCHNDTPNPLPGQIIRPYVKGTRYLAQEILPADALLINQRMDLTMLDELDGDIGIDPYRVSPTLRQAPGGSESITAQGTFWRKLIARNKNYKNRRVYIRRGFIAQGFTEADYRTVFTGVLDNVEVAADGSVKLSATGLLKLTDVDFPQKTDGRLGAALSAGAASLTLSAWSGVDRYGPTPASKYKASGYIKIDDEIMGYGGLSLDVNTGITTISGLSRGLFLDDGWMPAATHDADAMVQQVEYLQGNPIDLIHTLLNYASILDGDIDVGGFAAQRDTWFSGVIFRGILHEPVKIKILLQELREQTLTNLWQGDDQLIHVGSLQPNPPGQPYREINDLANIIYRSRAVNDHEEQRLTRVAIYYNIHPNKSGSDTDHYARAAVVVDADAESSREYAETKARKPILSRWMRSWFGAEDYARITASRMVKRFRDGARTITFDLELKDENLQVAEVFRLSTGVLSDISGAPALTLYQVTKKDQTGPGRMRYTAIETPLNARYAYIAATGGPDYTVANDTQRQRAFIASSVTGKMSNGDDPYLII